MLAYKLFRLRTNGTLGALFLSRRRVLEPGKWISAEILPKQKGYAYRPGWHVFMQNKIPKHLSAKGRVLLPVEGRKILGRHSRPKMQGGFWYTVMEIKIMATPSARKRGLYPR